MKLGDLLYLAAIGAIAYAVLKARKSSASEDCWSQCMQQYGDTWICKKICG